MNHIGKRGFLAFLRRMGALPWVLWVAQDLKCAVCQQWTRRPPLPLVSGKSAEPLDII